MKASSINSASTSACVEMSRRTQQRKNDMSDRIKIEDLNPKILDEIKIEDSIQMMGKCHCSCK